MSPSRTRLRWLLFGALYAGATTAAVVLPLRLLSPLGGSSSTAAPRSSPSPSPLPTTPQEFVPPTALHGDKVVLPVTFPDGSTADLVYPPGLKLAERGIRPYTSGCNRDFNFFYSSDPRGSWYRGDGPIETYAGADGQQVELWNGFGRDELYMRFRFGSWTVLMYDYEGAASLTEDERAGCAASLRGSETPEGFIVLEADPSLPGSVAPLAGAGDHAGPELMFGDLDPGLFLFPGECTPAADDAVAHGLGKDQSFASWCDPDAPMRVHVYDDPDREFIEAVLGGLEIRNVVLAE